MNFRPLKETIQRSVSPDPPTMAECDPSQAMRTKIRTDLNVKGLVGCPCKIDMSKIIPVYSFQSSNRVYQEFDTTSLSLAGVTTSGAIGICSITLLGKLVNNYRLNHFACEFEADIAGRAAMAALNEEILVRFLKGAIPVMNARFAITASAGLGLHVWLSTHDVNVGPAASMWAGVDMIRLAGNPLQFSGMQGGGMSDLNCELLNFSGVNFPANTNFRFMATWDYED